MNAFRVIIVILFIFGGLLVSVAPVHAATGDITAVTVRSDGWSADVDISNFISTSTTNSLGFSTNNDPTNAKIVFTVTSNGYDATGAVTTLTRTVYGTKIIRQPYPNESSLDVATTSGKVTIRIALSDYIYGGETATVTMGSGWYTDNGPGGTGLPNNAVTALSVTNNATLPYPKSIGRWAWPGYERVTGDFLVEAVAFNRFARNGKPLAAMVFTASDASGHTVYATTTEMTKTTRTGDANIIQVYAATIPVSTLTQGDIITVNFKAYPWVGTSSSLLNSDLVANGGDGYAQPDERLGPLYELNDKSGTYGLAFAVVDDTNGLDTNATTYIATTQSAAETDYGSNNTHSYKSIGRATAAIKAYNNANYSRNEPGGGVILLNSGSHAYPGTAPAASGAMNTWLIIQPMSTVSQAQAVIDGSTTFGALNTRRIKITGVTLAKSVAGSFFGTQATDVLWVDSSVINGGAGTTIFYVWNQVYATRNSVTALAQGFKAGGTGANRGPFSLVRGNTSASTLIGSEVYCMIGNRNIQPTAWKETGNNAGEQISDGSILAFNSFFNLQAGAVGFEAGTATIIATGTAIVQNVFESESNISPLVQVSATTQQLTTSSNVLIWNNIFAGARQNLAYNGYGSAAILHTNWSLIGNQYDDWNLKNDIDNAFDTKNGGRVGNWSIVYGAGSSNNLYRDVSSSDFNPEFNGLHAIYTSQPGFVSDRSFRGSGTGNGDYTLYGTSTAIDLATSTSNLNQVLPYDFLGNPIYGSPDAGAYEYQPPYTMGTHPLATSSIVRTYGDEKWRPRFATTTSGTADLNVALPGSDTTQWLDISVSNWQNTGTRHKVWTEMSSTTGLTNTVHIVGDLAASTGYIVKVDDVQGQNITGASCTSGVCTSNGSGRITFTYTGTYSVHTFDVTEQPIVTPTVTTQAASSITTTAATLNGNITATGGADATEHGFAYGTASDLTAVIATTTLGAQSGTGAFTGSLSGLSADTTYYFRPYAVNSAGTSTGSILSFSTDAEAATPVATPTPTNTSSSGSSASGQVSSLVSMGLYNQARLVANQYGLPDPTTNLPAQTTGASFTRSLGQGTSGSDVRALQTFLNSRGFTVATQGAGSPGHETSYFGLLTRSALMRFQEAYRKETLDPQGLKSPTGFFGRDTRGLINSFLKQAQRL